MPLGFPITTPSMAKAQLGLFCYSNCIHLSGPALASAGPDWKHFCKEQVNGAYRNIKEHQVIILEIISDVKVGRGIGVIPG